MQLSRFLTGLRLSYGVPYRLDGKRYIAGYDEERVVAILRMLLAQARQATRPDWLLQHRDAIREIDSLKTRAFLSYTISTNSDDRIRRLAIWLRGRCGGYIGSTIVAQLAQHEMFTIRKEVARCLKRLSAWVALREMSTNDPSPRVRAFARQPVARPYARRQEHFLEGVSLFKTTAVSLPLTISPSVDFNEDRPAKPVWLIRQILARIHSLVTGA